MTDDNKITIVYDDEEVLAKIIFTHYSKVTEKEYVVYEIVGTEEYSAAVYVETGPKSGYFEDLETDEEWKELQDVLDEYLDSLEDEEDDD